MICRVNEEEEEEEREPRGEMMNEPLFTPPLFLSVHSEISFLPAPYFFFFFSLGDDKSSEKFLIERTRRLERGKLFLGFIYI